MQSIQTERSASAPRSQVVSSLLFVCWSYLFCLWPLQCAKFPVDVAESNNELSVTQHSDRDTQTEGAELRRTCVCAIAIALCAPVAPPSLAPTRFLFSFKHTKQNKKNTKKENNGINASERRVKLLYIL